MAKLIITNYKDEAIEVNGKLTFNIAKVIDEETGELGLQCQGRMTTHKYIEEISKIETSRYLLENIEVIEETFGSNDFDILYDFIVKDFGWTIKENYDNEEAIKKIEEELYKNDEGDRYDDLMRGDK